MKALLINNKEIILDGVKYTGCPELEEYKEYTIVDEIPAFCGHAPLYVIEESDRWLLQMRFVVMTNRAEEEEGITLDEWLLQIK